MTSSAITNWLRSRGDLPEAAELDAALHTWPWFTPTRMMEAVRAHQQSPFSTKALTMLQLYGGSWLPSYELLSGKTAEKIAQAPPLEDINVTVEYADAPQEIAYDTNESLDSQAVHKRIEEPLIQPLYTEDYFRHQGIEVVQTEPEAAEPEILVEEQPQTLMIVMSFAEWLTHFKTKTQKELEEAKEKSALRSMWQQEKLAAAMQEDSEEIPADVFEMAVSSITREDDIVSEPLAQIYERQEKWNAAADMYRKLALKYPAKSSYFASRAEAAKKRQP